MGGMGGSGGTGNPGRPGKGGSGSAIFNGTPGGVGIGGNGGSGGIGSPGNPGSRGSGSANLHMHQSGETVQCAQGTAAMPVGPQRSDATGAAGGISPCGPTSPRFPPGAFRPM